MTDKEYQQKKRECWEDFCRKFLPEADSKATIEDVIDFTFDRAYALGREKETIKQEGIEKAAEKYSQSLGKSRDVTWNDGEYGFVAGANFALGKQEKDADTVISGWVCRDKVRNEPFTSDLFIVLKKPTRVEEWGKWCDCGDYIELDSNLFPDLTWSDDPQEVEIIIKRKKK